MAKIKVKKNERGFRVGTFFDSYGAECSIQKSSSAMDYCILLGINDADPQIMSSDAIRMGLKDRAGNESDNGWVKFEIPKEVLLNTRMHLTRKQVKELLPILQKFVDTGDIS